jgi:hypothetical protein
VDAALPLETSREAKGKPATFGTASLVFAVLTIVLPVLVMLAFGQKATREADSPEHGGWGGLVAIGLLFVGVVAAAIVSGLSSLAGTITGVVALARGERRVWRSVVGLVVNVPVLLVIAYTLIVVWISNGG